MSFLQPASKLMFRCSGPLSRETRRRRAVQHLVIGRQGQGDMRLEGHLPERRGPQASS
jgi:hypothetical protein